MRAVGVATRNSVSKLGPCHEWPPSRCPPTSVSAMRISVVSVVHETFARVTQRERPSGTNRKALHRVRQGRDTREVNRGCEPPETVHKRPQVPGHRTARALGQGRTLPVRLSISHPRGEFPRNSAIRT